MLSIVATSQFFIVGEAPVPGHLHRKLPFQIVFVDPGGPFPKQNRLIGGKADC